MQNLTLESSITLRQAYLIMFDFLDQHWIETGKPDDLGSLLGEMSLSHTAQGKLPMDAAVFPRWIDCAKRVLEQEQTAEGYTNADIKFT